MMGRLLILLVFTLACSAQEARHVALADFWANRFGVERELVHAVIEAESNWNAVAVSRAGAVGLMQLMPDTAAAFGVANRFEATDNIRGGVAYLASLLREFRGERRLAVAAYNAGATRLLRGGLRFRDAEVVSYTRRVAYFYRRNRWQFILQGQKEARE